jgi:hypothetical protein
MKAFLLLTISLFLLAEDYTGVHTPKADTKPDDKRVTQPTPTYLNTVFFQREENFKKVQNSKTFVDGNKRMFATDCIIRSGTNFERKQGILFIDGKFKPPRLYGLYFKKNYDPNWLTNYSTYKGQEEYTEMYIENMSSRNRPKALRQGMQNGAEYFLKTNGDISIHYTLRGVGTATMLYEINETKKDNKGIEIPFKKTICEVSKETLIQLKS